MFALKHKVDESLVGKSFSYDGTVIGEIIDIKQCSYGTDVLVKIPDESVLNKIKGKFFKSQFVSIE